MRMIFYAQGVIGKAPSPTSESKACIGTFDPRHLSSTPRSVVQDRIPVGGEMLHGDLCKFLRAILVAPLYPNFVSSLKFKAKALFP